MKLSILIPVFNEEKTLAQILKKIFAVKIPVKEVEYIIINDGSTDASSEVLKKYKFPKKNIKLLKHNKNQGKGAAVITGMKKATGDYLIIQDADLEYDPKDIVRLLQALDTTKKQVVYGTRLKRLPNLTRDERHPLFLIHYLGNKFLSLATSILFLHWVTDMECCYKLFPREAIKNMTLHARGFEFEPEITAKLLKKGYKISEVSITTKPRGYDEGKKLNTVKDGIKAVKTLVKYRFTD